MTQIRTALAWAGIMILLALAAHYGLVERKTAQTLFLVIPIFAALEFTRRRDRACLRPIEGSVSR